MSAISSASSLSGLQNYWANLKAQAAQLTSGPLSSAISSSSTNTNAAIGNSAASSSSNSTSPLAALTQAISSLTSSSPQAGGSSQVHHHHHHHGFGGQSSSSSSGSGSNGTPSQALLGSGSGSSGGLFQSVQNEVTSNLQIAQANTTGPVSNPDQIVQSAISKVFAAALSGANAAPSSTTPSTSSPTSAAGMPDAEGNSAQVAFYETLKGVGISPQQFEQDFMAGVQQAIQTSGTTIPTGSIINTMA